MTSTKTARTSINNMTKSLSMRPAEQEPMTPKSYYREADVTS